MNVKTTAPLAVAGLLGLVAAIVASQIVNKKTVIVGKGETVDAAMNLVPVVVTKRDVPPGAVLNADDLTIAHVDAAAAPMGPKVAADPTPLIGRVAKLQIPRGQIVHETFLAEKGTEGGLPGVIPDGYRAMTLEINEFSGVAGLLEPGNHVDILARVSEREASSGDTNVPMMTRTVAQNVQIIAVGPSLTNRSNTSPDPALAPAVPDAAPATRQIPRSVTLLVTPEAAERIDLAASTNQARLVLRASTDSSTSNVRGATLASIRSNGNHTDRLGGSDGFQVDTASAHANPQDDVFGPNASRPMFHPTRNTRSITVIRAGVPSQIDVEMPRPSKDVNGSAPANGPSASTPIDPTASVAN